MFGLGMGEIMVILVVALLVLGPTKLPDAAKQIGKAIRELRRHTQNLQETIEQDEHIGGTVRELKSALRGLDEPVLPASPKPRPAVPPPIDQKDEKSVAQGEAEPPKVAAPVEPPPAEPKPVEPMPPPVKEPTAHG